MFVEFFHGCHSICSKEIFLPEMAKTTFYVASNQPSHHLPDLFGAPIVKAEPSGVAELPPQVMNQK